MDEKGYSWTRLDGSMNSCQRNEVIAHFQDNSPDSPQVLLLSLRAGMSIIKISIISDSNIPQVALHGFSFNSVLICVVKVELA